MKLRFKKHKAPGSPKATGQAGFRQAAVTKKVRAFGFLFGLPFFAAGALFCWFAAIKPILAVVESDTWPEVPCRIVSSKVETIPGDDGETYRIAITFAYIFEGQEYTGGSYNFSDMSSSGYKGKAKIAARFPVGLETACRVNPRDPSIAVLSRDMPGEIYFILPFTAIFMLVGGFIMLGSTGLLPKKWSGRFSSKHERVAQTGQGQVDLKPSSGPVAKLVGTICLALFWNGIVGVFVWQVVESFRQGDPEWFLVFFLIPFVAIGIGALGAILYFALALTNPKLRLSLNEGSPPLGGSVRLSWSLSGSVHRLQDLRIALEGREEATYRRGTKSVTDKSLFCREIIFETDDPVEHRNGQVSFSIPAHLMHTFSGRNNKIKWCLHVSGSIPRWPDVKDNYPIIVRPAVTPK